jgi:para-nitrobenzyl esterase
MRLLLLLILVLSSVGTKALADAPIVRTQNGDVVGVLQGTVESFKALPYAAPPVGDLRWRPPQDPANWFSVRDGSKFAPACPQKNPDSTSPRVIGSEDCLYLNVFKPQGARRLPVLVFIHGGHNTTESAGVTENGVAAYDASDFVQNNDVVVVTINYRLGALGFIAHPALSDESGYNASGNYGYMDQIRALKWVKHNIAAFGGDSDNVTLFGRSAGAGGIMVLMASPLAEGMFHRAIIHSGQFDTQTLKHAHDNGVDLAKRLKCDGQIDNSQILRCMRSKRATEILLEMPGGHPHGSVAPPALFVPVIDGRILPDDPIEIIGHGKHHHMPVLIGSVKEETSAIYYLDSATILTESDYIKTVKMNYRALATELLRLYPVGDYNNSPRQAYNAISADHLFVCPAQRLVRVVSDHQSEFVGRFFYTHVFPGPDIYPAPHFFGATHGFDTITLFGSFGFYELTPGLDELTLRDKFQEVWAEFAKSGHPGKFWSRYQSTLDNYVVFDVPMSLNTQLRTKQCDFWARHPRAVLEIGATAEPSGVNNEEVPPR